MNNIFIKIFKFPLFLTTLIVFYIILYIFYINHSYIFISKQVEHELSYKYVNLLYGFDIEDKYINNSKVNKNINLFEENLYSTINHEFTLNIPKLGIREKVFIFPATKEKSEYKNINSKKVDKNLVNLEVNDLFDLSKGFMIGGHSSGYFYDKSPIKNIFNSLNYLENGDEVELIRDDGFVLRYKVKNKNIYEVTQSIPKYASYIYTCYPIGSNKQRLVFELEFIK